MSNQEKYTEAVYNVRRRELELERLITAARQLVELDAQAFIGWEPAPETKDKIEAAFGELTEALQKLAPQPERNPE